MTFLSRLLAWRVRRRHEKHLRWLRKNHVLGPIARDERNSIERFNRILARRETPW